MSLPIRLYADTVNSAGGTALNCPGTCLDFRKARVFAFRDKFADFVCAHIYYWGKFGGYNLRPLYNSRLSKNGLDFIACCKHPTPTIKNDTTLRLPELLFDTNINIVFAFEIL